MLHVIFVQPLQQFKEMVSTTTQVIILENTFKFMR